MGLRPLSLPFAFAMAMPSRVRGADQVSLELGDHREHVEQQPANRVVGVVDGASDLQPDAVGGELVDDVARVADRAGEAIELGHHERVPGPGRGQGLAEPGPVAVGAGRALVDVDASRVDSHRLERLALGGEVLFGGRAACVPDERRGHAVSVADRQPSPGRFSSGSIETVDIKVLPRRVGVRGVSR